MEAQGCERTSRPVKTESVRKKKITGVTSDSTQTPASCVSKTSWWPKPHCTTAHRVSPSSVAFQAVMAWSRKDTRLFLCSPFPIPLQLPYKYTFFSLEKQLEIPGKRYYQVSTIGLAYSWLSSWGRTEALWQHPHSTPLLSLSASPRFLI